MEKKIMKNKEKCIIRKILFCFIYDDAIKKKLMAFCDNILHMFYKKKETVLP